MFLCCIASITSAKGAWDLESTHLFADSLILRGECAGECIAVIIEAVWRSKTDSHWINLVPDVKQLWIYSSPSGQAALEKPCSCCHHLWRAHRSVLCDALQQLHHTLHPEFCSEDAGPPLAD